jgi:hypothetical protein
MQSLTPHAAIGSSLTPALVLKRVLTRMAIPTSHPQAPLGPLAAEVVTRQSIYPFGYPVGH